ncbi:MAG: hypothetical protein JWO19_1929 [Bryobacterales bacterium]|nr:hypothetical protein [Bryobacterales bacterium]
MATFEDLLSLSLEMIDLQRARIARAAQEEMAEGALRKDLSVELKRLNGMMTTYNDLLNSPQSRIAPQPPEGPSLMENLLNKLQESQDKRARGGRKKQICSSSEACP